MPVCCSTLVDAVEEAAVFCPDGSDTQRVVFICSIERRPRISGVGFVWSTITKYNEAVNGLLRFLVALNMIELYVLEMGVLDVAPSDGMPI